MSEIAYCHCMQMTSAGGCSVHSWSGKSPVNNARTYTQAELTEQLKAATERMPCGHLEGDLVEACDHRDCDRDEHTTAHCRTCAELTEAIAKAQVGQREAIARLVRNYPDKGVRIPGTTQPSSDLERIVYGIEHAPLASPLAQDWLERRLEKAVSDESHRCLEMYLSDMQKLNEQHAQQLSLARLDEAKDWLIVVRAAIESPRNARRCVREGEQRVAELERAAQPGPRTTL